MTLFWEEFTGMYNSALAILYKLCLQMLFSGPSFLKNFSLSNLNYHNFLNLEVSLTVDPIFERTEKVVFSTFLKLCLLMPF